MNKSEAFKLDTEFYVDFDNNCGYWCVFGNNTGFAYSSWFDYAQAKEVCDTYNYGTTPA